jgi:glycosyltransferase involved in cell wall biosynthesis
VGAALDGIITRVRPDVVVVQSWRLDMVATALRCGCGAMLYSHTANSTYADTIGEDWRRRCLLVANSHFNARFQGEALGEAFAVLYPLVRRERYLVESRRTEVLQVGASQRKGAALTLAIARARPDIPFTLVRAWEGLHKLPEDIAIEQEARALANVRLVAPDKDMRHFYRRAKILLVPSVWEETWGRVVTEAQFNGIPVVASDRGGLVESVGDGGIVLSHDGGIAPWVEAVGRLWDDPARYAEGVERARRRVERDDVAFTPLRDRFIAMLEEARRRV